MRFLLLGTGYIGMALLNQWNDKNIELWATTTSEEKIPQIESLAEKAILLHGMDKIKLKEVLDQCDGVVITVAPKKGSSYEETYLVTAKTVRDSLKERQKPFYLLYTSTTSVYGNHNGEWVNESTRASPESEEAKILLKTEEVYLQCPNSETCILRLGGIYGPDRTLEKRAQMMSGRTIPGSGKQPTNNSQRDDITKAIIFSIKNRLQGIYNIVNDDHIDKESRYKKITKDLGIKPPVWDQISISIHGSNCKVSNKKIKDLGFMFQNRLSLYT